ncbi:MAG: hypothetical protein QOD41_1514 [Cryptosporangiaceae bacterium]|nr:hypothetical protein [Cryptosporangiaceae bacterium]
MHARHTIRSLPDVRHLARPDNILQGPQPPRRTRARRAPRSAWRCLSRRHRPPGTDRSAKPRATAGDPATHPQAGEPTGPQQPHRADQFLPKCGNRCRSAPVAVTALRQRPRPGRHTATPPPGTAVTAAGQSRSELPRFGAGGGCVSVDAPGAPVSVLASQDRGPHLASTSARQRGGPGPHARSARDRGGASPVAPTRPAVAGPERSKARLSRKGWGAFDRASGRGYRPPSRPWSLDAAPVSSLGSA